MAKRQRSINLSFVLLRFAMALLGGMVFCVLICFILAALLQRAGIACSGYMASSQAVELINAQSEEFVPPGGEFLPEYALFDREGNVLYQNVSGKKLDALRKYLSYSDEESKVLSRTYDDGSVLVVHWYYRKEFANPVLRRILMPFDYLMWYLICFAYICWLLFSIICLKREVSGKLELFREVSEKIASQQLEFEIPRAGIREFDEALEAMDEMRRALYESLTAQWASGQAREAEIAALAHDLKTPITLIGGNAELLLEGDLPESCRKLVKTIETSNLQVKKYVNGLLDASAGNDEAFVEFERRCFLEEGVQNMLPIAEKHHVQLRTENRLSGTARIQKEHLLRALINIIQNAIEYTPEGGTVFLSGEMTKTGWELTVRDEGPGFSKAALSHAVERLWRGDTARTLDGHNGLGLWFAEQVIRLHAGNLEITNGEKGGIVVMRFEGCGKEEQMQNS